jgi:hypothetical protein
MVLGVSELGVGVLSFKVLPVYAGAVNHLGEEPITSPLYKRGMIRWDVMPNGEQVGHVTIDVPAGLWRWAIYCFHPTKPLFYAVEKLPAAVALASSGVVTLDCITMENIQPNAHPLGVLPD